VRIGLNDLKTVILISMTKNTPDALEEAVEENELHKDGKKTWKTMKNTSINLYCINFFIFL